ALAHGLAVITSQAGALPEVVRHGAEALLVPPGDRRALLGALALLTRDRVRLSSMQHQALERARSLPRWPETQEAFAAALRCGSIPPMANIGYERTDECLVVVRGQEAPSDSEFEWYLATIETALREGMPPRCLVLTEGAAPTPAQRAELAERVAIVEN